MMIDNHYETIDELRRAFNGDMARLLPGYINRHRAEIMAAVRNAAKDGPPPGLSDDANALWGAATALNILAEGLLKGSTETPSDETSRNEGVL